MDSARDTLSGGLPHSEIPGSTIARISPGLFAACHVLHRLSVPRHPPDALTLRLSATPNGKNHNETGFGQGPNHRSNCVPRLDPGPTHRCGKHSSPGGAHRFATGTLRRFRRHFARYPSRPPAGRPRGCIAPPPRSARRRFAGYRYGHTTRFFTIVNQHAPPPPCRGCREGRFGSSRRVSGKQRSGFRDRRADRLSPMLPSDAASTANAVGPDP
jgi:hypothetical protein